MNASVKASSLKLPVMKLVGTGNDFLFIDARAELPGEFARVPRAEIVRRLCDRHFGLGSDGLVFIEDSDEKVLGRYRWDFYNTDGSHAEMCGNASRCVGRWASLKLGLSQIEFTTAAGQVTAKIDGANVNSYLNFVSAHAELKNLRAAGRDVGVYFVNTGVPHFVAKVASIEHAMKDLEIIRALRFHEAAGPRGANVTFLEIVGPQRFKTVTYERGVEDFTLSCGTGVIAAAAVGLQLEQGDALEASVRAPGGELHVKFEKGFSGVSLIGAAEKIFETEIGPEVLEIQNG